MNAGGVRRFLRAARLVRRVERGVRRGLSVADACRRVGVHRSTYFRQRKKLQQGPRCGACLGSSRTTGRRDEELALLRRVVRTWPAHERRQAALWAQARLGASRRLAAAALGVRCAGLSEAKPPLPDLLTERIRQLAGQHPAAGYRTIWALLRRAGETASPNQVYRRWRQLRFTWDADREDDGEDDNATASCGAPGAKQQRRSSLRSFPAAVHSTWSLDLSVLFTHQARCCEVFAALDEASRFCLALDAAERFDAHRIGEVLGRLFATYGPPRQLRVDRTLVSLLGPSVALLALHRTRVVCAGGKSPARNPFVESFLARFKAEVTELTGLVNAEHAALVAARYRHAHNHCRPHSSLDYRTPVEALREWGGDPSSNETAADSPEPAVAVIGSTKIAPRM